ncbi:MAG: hypothetical protein KJ624_04745 [Chloroflexi bacterium]|nr:hypothetical protein [Chloroflexota bacterium]
MKRGLIVVLYSLPFTLFAVLLNFLHEVGHATAWHLSGIPTCVYFNEATPEGGIQFDPRYLAGVASGPAVNLLVALVLTLVYVSAASSRSLFLFSMAGYALLQRLLMVMNYGLALWVSSVTAGIRPDEIISYRILAVTWGAPAALSVLYGFLAITVVWAGLLSFSVAGPLARRKGWNRMLSAFGILLGLFLLILFVVSPLVRVISDRLSRSLGPISIFGPCL